MKDKAREAVYSVSAEDIGKRIDQYLAKCDFQLSRSRIQALIKEGLVTVNEKVVKCSYKLKLKDSIKVIIPPERPLELEPEYVDFEIIYEDEDVLVIDKPAGVVIHPAPGHYHGTLVHGLIYRCEDLAGIGGVLRPGIVHRLDKDTSGIMVVAKSEFAHNSLVEQFKNCLIEKEYWALVHGPVKEKEGKIDLPIGRHPVKRKQMWVLDTGKRAVTVWKKISDFGNISLLAVYPKTGRTHQIRVHFSYIGHPVVGDQLYGKRKDPYVCRQMLHARRILFQHPKTGKKMEFCSHIPADMKKMFAELNKKLET